jgi:hypothetical protein
MKIPDYFIDTQGKRYEQPASRGYGYIDVLSFLIGRPWNEIALAYVHAVRPSSIRVIKGEETTDSQVWRVSVYIDHKNIIEKIKQEVEVALPNGICSGYELRAWFDMKD